MKKLCLMILVFSLTTAAGDIVAMEKTKATGTKVNLVVGSASITATLNDSVSARDLIAKLPCTVKVSRATVDYCGVLPGPLKSDASESRRGWKNGEISYIPGADWIAFFFGGENGSSSDGNPQHIVGKVDDLSALRAWPGGSIEVRIELYK